jgi:release factor glutamine methyltransferase
MADSSILQKYKLIRNELSAIYPISEAQAIARIAVESVTKIKIHEVLANPELKLTPEDNSRLDYYISELKLQKPLQYILGTTTFFGLEFTVNPHVLIPRPETEELVEWIIRTNDLASPSILDIGTGSGCIAIALAKNIPKAKVFALDISPQAIETAMENAKSTGVNINFINGDVLSTPAMLDGAPFDIFVSNPPYVRECEKEQMEANVLKYEPELALFVNDANPLKFYKAIAKVASTQLMPNGLVFCEINEAFGRETASIFTEWGFTDVTIRKDINGKERMLSCRKRKVGS